VLALSVVASPVDGWKARSRAGRSKSTFESVTEGRSTKPTPDLSMPYRQRRERGGKHFCRDTIRKGIQSDQIDCRPKKNVRLVEINAGRHKKLDIEQANIAVLNQKWTMVAVVSENAAVAKLKPWTRAGVQVHGPTGALMLR